MLINGSHNLFIRIFNIKTHLGKHFVQFPIVMSLRTSITE